jgi:hypothetical protein
MPRQRRKQKSVVGAIVFELSALAGILGIAQPTLRETVWEAITKTTASMSPSAQVESAHGQFPQGGTPFSQQSFAAIPSPAAVYPEPTTYSAQMIPLAPQLNPTYGNATQPLYGSRY